MTVQELIEQLKQCKPDAVVEVMDLEGDYSTDVEQLEEHDDRVYLFADL